MPVQLTILLEKVKEMLGDIVKSCYEKAQGQQKAEGYIKLECKGLPPSPCLVSTYRSTLATSGLVSCPSVPVS